MAGCSRSAAFPIFKLDAGFFFVRRNDLEEAVSFQRYNHLAVLLDARPGKI
jgi:hypothetical protein